MQDRVVAQNLRASIPANLDEELVTILAASPGARVERIVSRGHTSPPDSWYDQAEGELVVLIDGAARLEIEGQSDVALRPGDWVMLAAHQRHRVAWTAPDADTVWLAVFFAAVTAPA